MTILGIESASLSASAAVLRDGKLLAFSGTNFKKTHSETLLPMISEVLEKTETEVSSLDAIAVSVGPGSYTGLRIGITTAKGLSYAGDIPVVPVPTLAAAAYGEFGSGYLLVPTIDARGSGVYYGLFSFEDGIFVTHTAHAVGSIESCVLLAEEAASSIGKKLCFLGDGADSRREEFLSLAPDAVIAPPHVRMPSAAAAAVLGEMLFREGKAVSGYELEPVYLKKTQAEQERLAMGLSIAPVTE